MQKESDFSCKSIVNVVVVHKDIINKKKSFFEEIGLNLRAVDIPEFSYRNYFEKKYYFGKIIALVVIKKNFCKLIILHKENVYFSRSFKIQYGGGFFDDIPESEIVLEVQRSLDYYERQLKKIIPTLIIIFGENVVENKITEVTRNSFNQDIFIESVDGFDFSEKDSLLSSRVIETYGASLRKDLINNVGIVPM